MDLRYVIVGCVIVIILLIFKIATSKCSAANAKGIYWIYESPDETLTFLSQNFVRDSDYIPIAKFSTWLTRPEENAVEINFKISKNSSSIGETGAPGMNLFAKSIGAQDDKLCIIKSLSGKVLYQRIGKCDTPNFKNIPPWQIDRFFYVENLKTWHFPKYRFSYNPSTKKYWIAECGSNDRENTTLNWTDGFTCCGIPDRATDFSGNSLSLVKLNIWEADGNRWLLPFEKPAPVGAVKYADINFLDNESSEIATSKMNLFIGTGVTKFLSDGIKSSLVLIKQYLVPYRTSVNTKYYS